MRFTTAVLPGAFPGNGYDDGMPDARQQIEHLRAWRARPQRDMSIRDVIESTAGEASRSHKKLGELVELWEQLIPAGLAAQTSLSGMRAGVLHVVVDSASAGFELDRLLRSGALAELRRLYRGTLIKVKTRVRGRE